MATRASTKRYLHLTVHEASGHTRDNEILWEPTFTEGFIKVEVRGGGKTVKVATPNQSVDAHTITWTQDLRVEITDADEELRIMLCGEKPRTDESKRSTTVIAACGIFVTDILDAVPIDKYFELFKPGERTGGLGGFVRIAMRVSSPRTAQGGRTNGVGLSPTMASHIQQRLAGYRQDSSSRDEPSPKRGRRFLAIAGLTATVLIVLGAVVK